MRRAAPPPLDAEDSSEPHLGIPAIVAILSGGGVWKARGSRRYPGPSRSVIRGPDPLAVLVHAQAEASGHVRNEGWVAAGEPAAPGKSALLAANGQQRSGFGHAQGWERKWEPVLLRSASTCFEPLPYAPLNLRRRTLMEAAAS